MWVIGMEIKNKQTKIRRQVNSKNVFLLQEYNEINFSPKLKIVINMNNRVIKQMKIEIIFITVEDDIGKYVLRL